MLNFRFLVTGIYDLTVGFKKTGANPTLLSILKGRSCQAEMFIRRVPIAKIPKETDECSDWVHKLYQEKDEIYEYFVQHDTFSGKGLPRVEVARNYFDLLIELFWMITIGIPSVYYLIYFLLTSSLLAQFVFGIVIALGRSKEILISERDEDCLFIFQQQLPHER